MFNFRKYLCRSVGMGLVGRYQPVWCHTVCTDGSTDIGLLIPMATGTTPWPAAPPEPDEHTAERRAKNPWLYEDEHLLVEGRPGRNELHWRDHFTWLKDASYLLCPRYSLTWSALWKSLDDKPWTFKESIMPMVRVTASSSTFLTPLQSSLVIDATRISDGSYVVLKRCDRLNPFVVSGFLREGQIFKKLFR
jgi:hypothetical protein